MRLYIAAPYGARAGASPDELAANVSRAIEAARALILKGHTPYCPHLAHYVQNQGPHVADEDRWLAICLEWVSVCEGIVMLPGWQRSYGAKAEHEHAVSLGLPIFYGLDQVPLPDDERRRRILRNHPAAAPCHQCPDVLECICQDLRVLDMGRFACGRADAA
jgi:hypothetical protein